MSKNICQESKTHCLLLAGVRVGHLYILFQRGAGGAKNSACRINREERIVKGENGKNPNNDLVA